jgi:transposase-like protein
VALFSFSSEPAHGRGLAGCSWDHRLAQTVLLWAEEFGRTFANEIRRRSSGRLGDKWHLDEAVVSIRGKKHWLWRAVDQDGFVLEVLVQSRRNTRAAKRLMRKLLKRQARPPRVIITEQTDVEEDRSFFFYCFCRK